jgi:hypothetical protein
MTHATALNSVTEGLRRVQAVIDDLVERASGMAESGAKVVRSSEVWERYLRAINELKTAASYLRDVKSFLNRPEEPGTLA